MSEPRVLTTIDGPVAHVTLNRPDQLNGVDLDLIDDMLATASTLRKNHAIRAIILQGSGRSFCAGLDFAAAFKNKRRVARYFFAGARTVNRFQKFSTIWRGLPVPVIAVVHGHCYGAGAQLAAGADFRFTTPDAQWAILEAKWGLVPDMGGTVPFIENMPIDTLQRLAMTGEVITGAQAVELGLASVATEDPMAEAMALVEQIVQRSPDSVAATKKLLYANQRGSRRSALRRERRLQAAMFKAPNTALAREAGAAKRLATFGPRTFS